MEYLKKIKYKMLIIIFMFVLINAFAINKILALGNDVTISVLDYGAQGDGVTNDVDAINSAINACDGITECTILFPNGEYIVENSVLISKSNIRLLGENNSTISFKQDIDLTNKAGVIVIKTVNQDVKNIVLENLIVNGNASDDNYGNRSTDTLGRGITVIRQGKYPGTLNYYEMSNIKIKNCTVKNTHTFGIAVLGGEQLKDGYTQEQVNEMNDNATDDFDLRKYKNFYDVNNVTIENCKISKTRIGIRLNRVSNVILDNNEVSDSRFENITLQVDNATVKNNKTLQHAAGCGSICLDKSDNVTIINNNINDTESSARDIDKTGICQNSSAGPSYNVFITNNNITGSSRGIWIKNHLKSANPHNKNDAGSRPGAGFIIKDNIINNSSITDIRIDELLDSKVVTGESVGKSYLYNKYNNSVNLESDNTYSGEIVGTNIKVEDNTNLIIVRPSKIKIAKLDKNNNYISGEQLQIIDSNNNIYGTYETTNEPLEVDLLLGHYILKDTNANSNAEKVEFEVENDNYQEKIITLRETINNNNENNNNNDNTNINDNTNTNTNSSNNPQTSYNVFIFIYMLIIGIIFIVGGTIYLKKKKLFDNK